MTESPIPEGTTPKTESSTNAPTRNMPLPIVLMVIAAIIVLIALSFKSFGQSRELEQQRVKWESQHITHNRMSVDFRGYGIDTDQMPLRVEVDDGKAVSVVDSRGNKMSPKDYSRISYLCPDTLTIPALFSFAQQTISDRVPTIDISYDPVLGYPEILDIVPYPEPCCQGFTIEVQDFEVVQ